MAASAVSLPDRVRDRFPIFESRVYINSCSQGALSQEVRQAYDRYLRDWDELGSPWELWVEKSDEARASFAGLIGCDPVEVAVTASVSAGVSALASGLSFAGGRRKVVVSDFEFPTIGQIWHAQEARGAEIVHVPAADAGSAIPIERFEAAIDEETALVSITQVCFRNGSALDVPAVVELAHERGALVLLDAYQGVGSIPIDVGSLGVDFLAAGTLKYLLASAGLGFFYCRRDLTERVRPTATGWFADTDIFQMDIHDYSPASTAARFQAGTPPVPSIYAGIAGIELIKEIGVAETRAHVQALNESLLNGLDELGAEVVTPRDPACRGALVCVATTDADRLVRLLDERGIVTSHRDGNLRLSAHCYNAWEDLEAVLGALADHRALLRPNAQGRA